MLNTAQWTADLVSIFVFEYTDDTGVPLFSQLAGLVSPADAAAAWADAIIKYCAGATAGGSPLTPPTQITAQKAALQAQLTASFALPSLLTDMVNAIGDLFQLAVATFGTFVITDTLAGRAPAIAALTAMPPTPDNASAAAFFAQTIDAMVKTFTATQPGTPPVMVTLL